MADLIFRRCRCMSFVKKNSGGIAGARIFSRSESRYGFVSEARFESTGMAAAGRSSTSAHCSRVDSEA